MTITLNKVDQHIKKCMLLYPNSNSTRFSVLCHMFMVNGNGYKWDKTGCLVEISPSFDRNPCEMYYDDLLSPAPEFTNGPGMELIADSFRVRNELALLNRKYIEENIDILCRVNISDKELTYNDLDHFDPEWSILGQIPFDIIDTDWNNAALEIIGNILYAFNVVFNLHRDDVLGDASEGSNFSQMPVSFQKKYLKIKEIKEKLTA